MNEDAKAREDQLEERGEALGLVDGSLDATTRRFSVVLERDAVVQLDDLLVCDQRLPDGRVVKHFGIVVEAERRIEGAAFSTDTARIARDLTMPGVKAHRVEVQVLRTDPELWLAPDAGATVYRALGAERKKALFVDAMKYPVPVGLDQSQEQVWVDFSFMNGEKGGHVNISGISGVATKTTYALFLLYQLLETPAGRSLLGPSAPETRALVFNVKGEDLLHIDRPNNQFALNPDAADGWARLGTSNPGSFTSTRLYAPRSETGSDDSLAPDVISRPHGDVLAFGWSPAEFVRRGLLRFCFAEADDAHTQVGFIEQRVRLELARHAFPMKGSEGGIVMCDPPAGTSWNFDKVVAQGRAQRDIGEGTPISDFRDLADFIETKVDPVKGDPQWQAGVQSGTALAFLRRLQSMVPRVGHLIRHGLTHVDISKDASVHVVDIHSLHTTAQRFVVGALLEEVFAAKQGTGRLPLRFVVLDELNKYAPRDGDSPIKDLLVDVAERGRSLGVLLIGAQQAASDVDPAIIRNASIKVVGRLDAAEASEYRFLTPELRERATRFLPGTMVLDQPLVPAPIPIRFPFPAFATNPDESRSEGEEAVQAAEEVFKKL